MGWLLAYHKMPPKESKPLGTRPAVGHALPLSVLCQRAKLGWPIAATLRRGRPWSRSTFFFYMDPLINDEGPGCYFQVSWIHPLVEPASEERAVFRLAWIG